MSTDLSAAQSELYKLPTSPKLNSPVIRRCLLTSILEPDDFFLQTAFHWLYLHVVCRCKIYELDQVSSQCAIRVSYCKKVGSFVDWLAWCSCTEVLLSEGPSNPLPKSVFSTCNPFCITMRAFKQWWLHSYVYIIMSLVAVCTLNTTAPNESWSF